MDKIIEALRAQEAELMVAYRKNAQDYILAALGDLQSAIETLQRKAV